MALKFKCDKCQQDIIVQFLKIGEIAVCPSCGEDSTVPFRFKPVINSFSANRKGSLLYE